MKHDRTFKIVSVGTIWLWLGLFALIPYCLTFFTSFMSQGQEQLIDWHFTLSNFGKLFNSVYLKIFFKSLITASICTLLCLIFGYPFSYALARIDSKYKNLLLLLVIIPFWTSSLVRSYAMIIILKTKGLLNSALLALGIIHQPLQILYSDTAVMIGLVYNLLPFMILPLYANIERLDTALIEAAKDLGANLYVTFVRVIIPLTLPGIIAGSILVFFPAMTIFYIPDLLGGSKSMLLGNLIQNQFLTARNWPLGSATSIVLTLLMGIMLVGYWYIAKNRGQQDLL